METNLVNAKVLKRKAKMMRDSADTLYAKAVTCRDIDDNVLDMKDALLSIFTKDEVESIIYLVLIGHDHENANYGGKNDLDLINGYLKKLRTVYEGEEEQCLN